jgi:hypothetical protein
MTESGRQPSVYTVLMKWLSTEGVTNVMLNQRMISSNLMAFYQASDYMINLTCKSNGFNIVSA